jgi:hypothetical protein
MTTRNGKIARLPLAIREQLNTRLADGEPGNHLVEWLNANPDVIKVMAEQFDGRPINENNISEWRQGGYEEWLTLRSFLDEARVLSEHAGEVAHTGISSERLHMVLIAHHAHLLNNLEIMPESDVKKKVDSLRKLTASIMNMRRAEYHAARLEIQRERLELLREKQSLQSSSASRTAASTSKNTRPAATDSRETAAHISASGPSLASASPSRNAESQAPPSSVPVNKPGSSTSPLAGRIQSDSAVSDPLRLSQSFEPVEAGRFPVTSDLLGLSLTHCSKLAA